MRHQSSSLSGQRESTPCRTCYHEIREPGGVNAIACILRLSEKLHSRRRFRRFGRGATDAGKPGCELWLLSTVWQKLTARE
jgi:hypothetical protein